ncbi:hypothetical protein SAMN06295879_0814 [Agreia bicolorata]|uniref:Uncharacterized protein n=1 Tax=Agreia bicolorata TaxID=110935 RepID=A0A1T4X7T9_9MICO|nr:hypothetical protein [Agreia bicolorata]SKA85694.1 hypothetical protein SAMN06295879_0814 [Agreia bicolorata]
MTSAVEPAEATEVTTASTLAAPDAPGLRMVGASGAVCVDGVCSIERVAPPSR